MITEEMIREREFDAFVAQTIAIWAGYAKKDNMGIVVVEELEN